MILVDTSAWVEYDRATGSRGLVDCMIAAVASGTATPVLAHDRDFSRIADVVDLSLDEHSLRP